MKSYNTADTTVSTKNHRVVVESDIKRRMRAVVNAMTTLATTGQKRDPVMLSEIIEQVRKQDKQHTYSRTDILYAIRKCIQLGMVQNVSWGVYRLTLNPKIAKTVVK